MIAREIVTVTFLYLSTLKWQKKLSEIQANRILLAGYNHSIANIMTTSALRTGEYVTFDEEKQEILAGGKVFKY